MLANVKTLTFSGIDAQKVEVQVHIAASGLPCFNIVGLPDKAVAESKERVRAAFSSIGLGFPNKRITVHLAPADLHKIGSHFDLAIALALLVAIQVIPQEEVSEYFVLGELALNGSLTSVSGILLAAIVAQELSCGLICPKDNGEEAAWSGNKDIITPKNLLELIHHFTGKIQLLTPKISDSIQETQELYADISDIKGQNRAKRALEIVAAGNHHLLMIGPPGSGKSMLAKRLPGLMPPMTSSEKLNSSIIASIAGNLKNNRSLITTRPFREPHSSSSVAAMVGGGKNALPGEITLAHLGVLFLDELPEFNRAVLDSLRQPLESGYITIARANNHVTYPSKFLLIAAMNPCKCGYYGDVKQACSRAPKCVQEYQSRISGPIYDRFDLQIYVSAVNPFAAAIKEESKNNNNKNSKEIAEKVKLAYDIQSERYKNFNIRSNSELDGNLLEEIVQFDNNSKNLLEEATTKLHLSMRGIKKIMKVSRTIADLAGRKDIRNLDVAEAINLRTIQLRK